MFLIVGSGLTGATIARTLRDQGHRVEVLERRNHIGGNVHDSELHGVRVHTYGPHYFRTNNDRIWEWVNRFAAWWKYEPCLLSEVDGELWPWPPTQEVLDHFGDDRFHEGPVTNFEEASLAMMPEGVYRRFVEGYTRKQWGVDPVELDADLAGRFDVRTTDLRLKPHKHQGIPQDGYAAFTDRILEGIPVHLNTEYDGEHADHVVYTGPIDAWFDHDEGHLAYRGQTRVHEWHPTLQQPCGQVNNPGQGDHIRTLEWAHMDPRGQGHGSVVTREYPCTPTTEDGCEYPFPDKNNAELYRTYRARANELDNVTICGRLGEYRYYDMDQAIGRALVIARRIGDAGAPSAAA